ncbi:MAG: hypothetical protein AB1340_01940 [Pseudomonadota bacterium]
MKSVRVEFSVQVPDKVTDDQIEEWVEFELGVLGGMSGDNPLSDRDLEAESGSVRIY